MKEFRLSKFSKWSKEHNHINVILLPGFGHGKMSDNGLLDDTGPVVINGCNF